MIWSVNCENGKKNRQNTKTLAMALKEMLFYKVIKRNKKLGLLILGYKAAKYGLSLYKKNSKNKRTAKTSKR